MNYGQSVMLNSKEKQEIQIANALDRIAKKQSLSNMLITYYPTLDVLNVGICFTHALSDTLNDFNLLLNEKTNTREQKPNIHKYLNQVTSYAQFGNELELYNYAVIDMFNECIEIIAKFKNKEKESILTYTQKDLTDYGPEGLIDNMTGGILDVLWKLNIIEEILPDEEFLD